MERRNLSLDEAIKEARDVYIFSCLSNPGSLSELYGTVRIDTLQKLTHAAQNIRQFKNHPRVQWWTGSLTVEIKHMPDGYEYEVVKPMKEEISGLKAQAQKAESEMMDAAYDLAKALMFVETCKKAFNKAERQYNRAQSNYNFVYDKDKDNG